MAINDMNVKRKDWNHKVFGNIFKKKVCMQAQIWGIQESDFYITLQGYNILEIELIEKINIVLD